MAGDITTLCSKLRKFDSSCIFNVDKAALLFKLLPRRTYIRSFEDKKSVRGINAMQANNCITAYIGTDATKVRVTMFIIEIAKKA